MFNFRLPFTLLLCCACSLIALAQLPPQTIPSIDAQPTKTVSKDILSLQNGSNSSAQRTSNSALDIIRKRQEDQRPTFDNGYIESYAVRSARSSQLVLERNSSLPISLGDNQSIITFATVLESLSPDHQFETILFTDGEVTNGTLNGNLIISGTGDPSQHAPSLLTSKKTIIDESVRELKKSGINKINGNVGSISTAAVWSPNGWSSTQLARHPVSTSDYMLSGNTIEVQLQAPNETGQQVIVTSSKPISPYLSIQSLASSGTKTSLSAKPVFGSNAIIISGQLLAGETTTITSALPNPDFNFAYHIYRGCLTNDLPITGGPTLLGSLPSQLKPLAFIQSKPLLDIILESKLTHIQLAEQLQLANASFIGDSYSNLAQNVWKDIGIQSSSMQLQNGSGIGQGGYITAEQTVHILAYESKTEHGSLIINKYFNSKESNLKYRKSISNTDMSYIGSFETDGETYYFCLALNHLLDQEIADDLFKQFIKGMKAAIQ